MATHRRQNEGARPARTRSYEHNGNTGDKDTYDNNDSDTNIISNNGNTANHTLNDNDGNAAKHIGDNGEYNYDNYNNHCDNNAAQTAAMRW